MNESREGRRTRCGAPLLRNPKSSLKLPGVIYFKLANVVNMAVKVESDKCTGCGECVSACPLDAIVIKDGKAVVDDSCAECGACVDVCPNKALVL